MNTYPNNRAELGCRTPHGQEFDSDHGVPGTWRSDGMVGCDRRVRAAKRGVYHDSHDRRISGCEDTCPDR